LGPSFLGYPFNPMYSMPGTSREANGMHNAAISFANPHTHNPAENEFESLADQQSTEEESEKQDTEDDSLDESTSGKKRSVVQARGQKRKAKETETSTSHSTEKSKKDKKEKTAQTINTPAAKSVKEKTKNKFGNKVWSDRRLMNKRRKGYKSKHRTIYKIGPYNKPYSLALGEESQQEKNIKTIEHFCREVAPTLEQNALWYFIASRSTNIGTKHSDLLWLKKFFKNEEANEYKKMVVGLEGYYPGVFDDMIDYIENHQPIRINKNCPPTEWEETLGDIYLREGLKINDSVVKDQDKISEIDEKYRPLAYAVHMILTLPEVYQDFSKISAEFIEDTQTSKDPDRNEQNQQILLSLHKLVEMHVKKIDDSDGTYEEIYTAFENIFAGKELSKLTIVDLYRELHTIVGKFYENAEAIESEYVLAGKCIITNHKYMKCEITADIASKNINRRVSNSNYSLEENRWNISPDTKKHYHIYYVDNTTQQLRMLCMPMHVDESGAEHYLHTINDIVEYIKKIYKIGKNSVIVYPFKVNKKSKKWSYIKKNDRKQTIKDLAGCEVVFYRITDNLITTKFTFAEFQPLDAQNKDIIRIPLFLTPLMVSAVDLGPFTKKDEHKEIESIFLENKEPDVYKYSSKYKQKQYSQVQNYYANLYILPDAIKTIECYSMDCKVSVEEDNTVKAEWYARAPGGIDEYTCCVLDKSFKEKRDFSSFNAFIETLESREYNKGSDLQGFWINDNKDEESESEEPMQKICNWTVKNNEYSEFANFYTISEIELKLAKEKKKFEKKESHQKGLGRRHKNDSALLVKQRNRATSAKYKSKVRIDDLRKTLCIKLSKKPGVQTDFIVFRNANVSKSNLGAHNEILDLLVSCYNHKPVNQCS
ncbi:hypothetical protein NEMIN01_2442, partial [Nematocida minor]|uniref:uncharacterized protein n=1 Tax=Nematocida minor TaxID=1912983 RepID=UPI00221F4C13